MIARNFIASKKMYKACAMLVLFLFPSSIYVVEANRWSIGSSLSADPVVNTLRCKFVGMDSALAVGAMPSDGGQNITSYGFCWSKNPNPTVADRTTSKIGKAANFQLPLKNLLPGSFYYIRAFVSSSNGTFYGKQQIFATDPVQIGKSIHGGYLVYAYQPGDPGYNPDQFQGLVALPLSPNWRLTFAPDTNKFANANLDGIFAGSTNTATLVATYGNGKYAAKIAADLDTNGYNDWYLPSTHELLIVKAQATELPVDVLGVRWSSTEATKSTAWLNVSATASRLETKNKTSRIVVIRKF